MAIEINRLKVNCNYSLLLGRKSCGKMRPVAAVVAWSVSDCCAPAVSPTKTAEPIEMAFGLWIRLDPTDHALSGGPGPAGEGIFFAGEGLFLPVKCITLCNQQKPQLQHDAANLSAGNSASRQKRIFRMDSLAAGVTRAEAMRPFVKIL